MPRKVTVALSGGVDSMCLTHMLSKYRKYHDPLLQIHALTIDHGYRRESLQEAHNIGCIVREWGVRHEIRKLNYDRPVNTITNFEEVARDLRYKAFLQACQEHGSQSLMVAHNHDDQLETFMLRLLMNSTIFGLRGLTAKAPFPLPPTGPKHLFTQPSVYRPLLGFDKRLIIETCLEEKVPWFEDLTNADPHLTRRNMLRHLINNYVPTCRTDVIHIVGKQALSETVEQIESIVSSFEQAVKSLDNYITTNCGLAMDANDLRISFIVDEQLLLNENRLVLSRWLFKKMYSLSPSESYHWSYAKIERHAVPKILEFITGPDRSSLLTYIGVKIGIRKLPHNKLAFKLSQQPLIRSYLESRTLTIDSSTNFLPWLLFNHTWWMRFASETECKMRVRPFSSFDSREPIQKFLGGPFKLPLNAPIVTDARTNKVISVPTRGRNTDGVTVELHLK